MLHKKSSKADNFFLVSMTGVSHEQLIKANNIIIVRGRSYNFRGLDIKLRLPDEFSHLESDIIKDVKNKFNRGRIEINLIYEKQISNIKLVLNIKQAQEVVTQLQEFARQQKISPDISAGQLLSCRDFIFASEGDELNIKDSEIKKLVLNIIENLLAYRRKEGELLGPVFALMLDNLLKYIKQIINLSKNNIKIKHDNLKQKMAKIFAEYSIEEARLYQECILLAERSDYQEELDRINAHIEHFVEICTNNSPKGRKLDFICQEILRECNTLLSKVDLAHVARIAVELKAEAERLREQVQNIE